MEMLLLHMLVALVFEYINGFHDTANSIATVVGPKVLSPARPSCWLRARISSAR
jgi:PiT family inorganic phosphate transporter